MAIKHSIKCLGHEIAKERYIRGAHMNDYTMTKHLETLKEILEENQCCEKGKAIQEAIAIIEEQNETIAYLKFEVKILNSDIKKLKSINVLRALIREKKLKKLIPTWFIIK